MHSANPSSLHGRLRVTTGEAHARLDGLMAHGIGNHAQYRRYLRGMHAFVAQLLPGLREDATAMHWTLPDWQQAIEDDLRAVGAEPLDDAPRSAPARGRDHVLGALYVVEGSALGARLLLRQVESLGRNERNGASFLHGHGGGERARWPRFLELLEQVGAGADHGNVCTGALDAFDVAERSFRRAVEANA